MITPDAARAAGRVIITNGFGIPRRGTNHVAHIQAAPGSTACDRTLREPNRLTGWLGNYRLCANCARTLRGEPTPG